MQSFSASPARPAAPRLLVVELWGLGDVALAVPFLRTAARHAQVTLLAKSHAGALLRRFCPEVEVIPLTAPWTAHRGKYRLAQWPWRELSSLVDTLRARRFAVAVSVRADPRDHLLMALTGAGLRAGFPRMGSSLLLTDRLARPADPHRTAAWSALARHLGFGTPPPVAAKPATRDIVIHTGAAQPTREWPRERFEEIATRLRATGRTVTVLDASSGGLDELVATLGATGRFIGNDSGPGHVAALLGVPTFTIMGPYPGNQFHPQHPHAAWVEGAPCVFKPCHDFCRFPQPNCILGVSVNEVWTRLQPWLNA